MRKIYLYITVISLFVSWQGLSSCSDDINYIDNVIVQDTYLYSDLSSYSFDAKGENIIDTEITSSSDNWSYRINDDSVDWVNITKEGESKLTINVTQNNTNTIRLASVILTNEHGCNFEFYVSQSYTLPQSMSDYQFYSFPAYELIFSPKGKYAAYIIEMLATNDTYLYTPVVINLETREVTNYQTTTVKEDVTCITDTGVLATRKTSALTSRLYNTNGIPKDVVIEGYSNNAIYVTNSDGSIMAGSGFKAYPIGKQFPIKWVNGEVVELSYPNTSLYGATTSNGAMVRGGNEDLSKLYGSEWSSYAPLVWIEDYCVDWGGDVFETTTVLIDYTDWRGQTSTIETQVMSGPKMTDDRQRMSANGKYVASSYYYWERLDSGYAGGEEYPIVYDTELNSSTVIWGLPGCHGMHVTNDGTFLSVIDLDDSAWPGYTYNMNTGEVKLTSQWLFDEYGVVVPEGSTVTKISGDGKVFTGKVLRSAVVTQFYLYWILIIP